MSAVRVTLSWVVLLLLAVLIILLLGACAPAVNPYYVSEVGARGSVNGENDYSGEVYTKFAPNPYYPPQPRGFAK